jgi:hypothetical protein
MSDSVPTAANQANSVLAEHAIEIHRLGKRAVIEIGRRLTECKRICGHGNWLPWLAREFGWSGSTALRYMRVYEMSKSVTVTDLGVPFKSLYLLAAPSTPETARTDIIKRAQSGEVIPLPEVKRTIDAAKGRRQPVKRRVPPPRDDDDSIGASSAGEIARKDDELRKRLAEIQNVGLRSHVEELCNTSIDTKGHEQPAKRWRPPRPSKSPDPVAVASAFWEIAASLNDVSGSPDEIARKLARLEELEVENVTLRSEVEDLRSENAGLREALDEASKKFTKLSGEFVALRDRMGQPAPPPVDEGLDIPAYLRRAAPAPATERGSG